MSWGSPKGNIYNVDNCGFAQISSRVLWGFL
ncbi:hypothetical protein CYB_2247 [Synechococcus sp. JA-2-3B'a(2-13)]|nr:hypothetical protein CYB_2247 [Synechococcus sp. JA-2-3B'a(2-13)]